MLSKIFEKLNNFSIQFTIFLIVLGIIIYTIIGMLAKKPNPNIEIKYFNIALYVILILIISNIGFSIYSSQQTKNKKGPVRMNRAFFYTLLSFLKIRNLGKDRFCMFFIHFFN